MSQEDLAAAAEEAEPSVARNTPKDPVFKELIQAFFSSNEQLSELFTVTPGLQVGQLQLEIDVSVSVNAAVTVEEIQTRLVDTPFPFFRRLNLIEFKSVSDLLNQAEFNRITARASLAQADYRPKTLPAGLDLPTANRLSDEVVSCIISTAFPREFLKRVRPGGKAFKQTKPGVYYHPGFTYPIYLIVCNRLPIEQANYPLLIFSSGEKLKEFLSETLKANLEIYFNYLVKLHPENLNQIYDIRRRAMTVEQRRKLAKIVADEATPTMYLEWVGSKRISEDLDTHTVVELIKEMLRAKKDKMTAEEIEQLKKMWDEFSAN